MGKQCVENGVEIGFFFCEDVFGHSILFDGNLGELGMLCKHMRNSCDKKCDFQITLGVKGLKSQTEGENTSYQFTSMC
jgi:hypothetical protein